jgi:hypothetical protein
MHQLFYFTAFVTMLSMFAPSSILICAQSDGVQMPPNITLNPTNTSYYYNPTKPANITLNCAASGFPAPKYTWYINGNAYQSGLSNGTINLDSRYIVEGFYKCLAINNWGTATSKVVYLQNAQLNQFSEQDIQTSIVQLGSNLMLTCSPPLSIPRTFSWAIKDPINSNPTDLAMSPRMQIDPITGNLHFAYVQDGDMQPPGYEYQCGVYNSYLNAKLFGSSAVITISNPGTNVPNKQPTLAFSTLSPATGLLSKSVTIACFFYGRLVIISVSTVSSNL